MNRRSLLFLAILAALALNVNCELNRGGLDDSSFRRSDWEAKLTPGIYCVGDPIVLSWDVGTPGGCDRAASCQTVELVDLLGSRGTTPRSEPIGSTGFGSTESRYQFRFTVTHDIYPTRFTWTPILREASAIVDGGSHQGVSFGAVCDGTNWSNDRFQAVIEADDYGDCVHARQVCNMRTNPVVLVTSNVDEGVLTIAPGDCSPVDWPSTDLIITVQLETPRPVLTPLRCVDEPGTGEVPGTPADPQPTIGMTVTFDCDPARPEDCRHGTS